MAASFPCGVFRWLAVLGVVVSFVRGASHTLVVNPTGSGSNNHKTLKSALDAAKQLTGSVAINLVAGTLSGPDNTNLEISIDVAINGVRPPAGKAGTYASVLDGGLAAPLLQVVAGGNLQLASVHLTRGHNMGRYGGGALLIHEGGQASVSDLLITNSEAIYGGAVSVNTNGAAQFQHCVFRHNKAVGFGGGAVFVNGTAPNFDSIEFVGNSAFTVGSGPKGGRGGALVVQAFEDVPAAPAFTNCVFKNNTASSTEVQSPLSQCGTCYGIGGAVNIIGASPTFDTCQFEGNVADEGAGISSGGGVGGAFVIVGTSTTSGANLPAKPTFKNCAFDTNIAKNGQTVGAYGMAGAGLIQSSEPLFEDCSFTGNKALANPQSGGSGGSGGAVVLTLAGALFKNSNFSQNQALSGLGITSGKGGAIYMQGSALNIDGGHFSGNSAHGASAEGTGNGGFGGAVALSDFCLKVDPKGVCTEYYPTTISIKGANFDSNMAHGSGGSTGLGQGGALALQAPNTAEIIDTVFNGNIAEGAVVGANPYGGQGGAIDCFSQPNIHPLVTIRGCKFYGNVATGTEGSNGGAVNLQTVSARIEDSLFVGNRVTGGAGGAVSSSMDIPNVRNWVNFTNCQFRSNSAHYASTPIKMSGGGAVFLESTRSSIVDCKFDQNSVIGTKDVIGGGAVEATIRSEVTLSGDQCSLVGNHIARDSKGDEGPSALTPLDHDSKAFQDVQVIGTKNSSVTVDSDCVLALPCADSPTCSTCQSNASCGYDASSNRCGLLGSSALLSRDPEDCCPSRCSGHGKCDILSGVCTCKWLYVGTDCSDWKPLWIGVFGGAGLIVLAIPFILFILRIQRRKRSTQLEDMRVSLLEHAEEQYLKQLPQSALVRPEEITCSRELGRGGMGVVYLGEWRGIEVAVKKSLSSGFVPLSEEELDELQMEARLQCDIRHPNICLFLGACLDVHNTFILTEFCSQGSLWDVLRASLVPWFRRHAIAIGTAKAITYLHGAEPPIIHRDIKSLNILVDGNWTAKLTDFGLTKKIFKPQPGEMLGQSVLTANIGTVQWTAPEVFVQGRQRSTPYDVAADVYSFAVVLWEIVHCKAPFYETPFSFAEELKDAVNKGKRPNIAKDKCPPEYIPLMQACWAQQPFERPTARGALDALLACSSSPGFVLESPLDYASSASGSTVRSGSMAATDPGPAHRARTQSME
eukprot:m.127311 g.127311  ORF g.127311 m.127311 type:complete len:1201 (-) comp16702_c0_seq4:136-3738(-)